MQKRPRQATSQGAGALAAARDGQRYVVAGVESGCAANQSETVLQSIMDYQPRNLYEYMAHMAVSARFLHTFASELKEFCYKRIHPLQQNWFHGFADEHTEQSS